MARNPKPGSPDRVFFRLDEWGETLKSLIQHIHTLY